MPERIITDSRGQRWDVEQDRDQRDVVFRRQSGHELRARVQGSIDGLSTEELLNTLDRALRDAGQDEVGHGGIDVAADDDGYETGR